MLQVFFFRVGAVAVAATLAGCAETATGPQFHALRVGPPQGWFGTAPGGTYEVGLTDTHRSDASSLYITGTNDPTRFGSVGQSLKPDMYRGQRVRWSAWAKHESLEATEAGLWIRVDGPTGVLAFDNMDDRPLTGSADWHLISVVVDVPDEALGFTIGALMQGSGIMLLDDGKLEIVGTDVPVTRVYVPGPPDTTYASQAASAYGGAAYSPRNMGFELVLQDPSRATSWISSHSVSLSTTDPTAPLDDLAPLTAMIGDAPIVGLGEGTHGTKEFFTMKHRIVKHLVTNMGFTYFAIEATSPEADDMNAYVLGGPGDPARLLSNLHFWTWNTQEVMDMILWMRAYNATVPSAQRVRFLGFDAQFPAVAMDSVTAFVGRVDPSRSSYVADRFSCIVPFRNGQKSGYTLRLPESKAACAAGLAEVYALIESQRTAYTAAEPARFEGALHAARLVQQFEAIASPTNSLAGVYARDKAMADNVAWIREQAGPSAKMVLWAHNDHVNAVMNWMGGHLRGRFGADYVALGFLFGDGSFNAVGGPSSLVQPWSVLGQPADVLERHFTGTGKALLLFDARQILSSGDDVFVLSEPIRMRSIGSTYDPARSADFYRAVKLPNDFDLLVFVDKTTATVRLPFVN
jgi:erythromycin esterase